MMKLTALVIAASLAVQPVMAAGIVERACVKSDRKKATRTACNCVQRVANVKLSRSDQKLAAKFFKDPHLSQEVRQSDNPSKEQFWLRYKAFGNLAASTCS